jgi:Chaperone of endosialidase
VDPNDGGIIMNMTNAASILTAIQFQKSGTVVGSITVNATNTGYNTSSDARLKTDVAPTRYGLADLRKIDVVDFTWIRDPAAGRDTGMLAQALHPIYPRAVTVQDDLWMVDYGKLTPLLIRSTQELDSRLTQAFEELHARVAALEAKP